MESLPEPLLPEEPASPACRNCGQAHAQLMGRNQLCPECYQGFVKYPIPMWIKAFGGGLLLVLIFSLSSLSDNFTTGIHFKRGEMAKRKKNYLTAENEFAKVVKREPSYTEAKLQLLMAAYNNHDFPTVAATYSKLVNEQITDEDLLSEVSSTLSSAASYYPSDSLAAYLEKHGNDISSIPETGLRDYLSHHSNEPYAMFALASRLFDEKKLTSADSMLNEMLLADSLQYNALCLKAPLKREMGQMDSSYYYSDKLLSINHEDTYALATKSRSLLKAKRDKEALEAALQSTRLNPKDGYAQASLALVYHFLHEEAKRDAIIKQVEADTSGASYLSYVKDVIEGKESFRN